MSDTDQTQWSAQLVNMLIVDCYPKLDWILPFDGSKVMQGIEFEYTYDLSLVP